MCNGDIKSFFFSIGEREHTTQVKSANLVEKIGEAKKTVGTILLILYIF